jgi:hypothetical protein
MLRAVPQSRRRTIGGSDERTHVRNLYSVGMRVWPEDTDTARHSDQPPYIPRSSSRVRMPHTSCRHRHGASSSRRNICLRNAKLPAHDGYAFV